MAKKKQVFLGIFERFARHTLLTWSKAFIQRLCRYLQIQKIAKENEAKIMKDVRFSRLWPLYEIIGLLPFEAFKQAATCHLTSLSKEDSKTRYVRGTATRRHRVQDSNQVDLHVLESSLFASSVNVQVPGWVPGESVYTGGRWMPPTRPVGVWGGLV